MGNPVQVPPAGPIPERCRHCDPAIARVSQIASLEHSFATGPRHTGHRTETIDMHQNLFAACPLRPRCRRRFAATFLAALALLCFVPAARAAAVDIGNGPVTSFFVLESPNLGIRDFRIHHNGVADAYGLLQLVLAHDPSVAAVIFNFGSLAAPNYFVNSITWSGVTETSNPNNPWVPYWGHWASGGSAGFPASAVAPLPAGSWQQGSGISSPYRIVGEGSWDALVFGDDTTPPGIQPVPEPVPAACLGLAVLFTAASRRRRI